MNIKNASIKHSITPIEIRYRKLFQTLWSNVLTHQRLRVNIFLIILLKCFHYKHLTHSNLKQWKPLADIKNQTFLWINKHCHQSYVVVQTSLKYFNQTLSPLSCSHQTLQAFVKASIKRSFAEAQTRSAAGPRTSWPQLTSKAFIRPKRDLR